MASSIATADRILSISTASSRLQCSSFRHQKSEFLSSNSLKKLLSFKSCAFQGRNQNSGSAFRVFSNLHTVEIEYEGKTISLEVPEDESILSAALENGIDLPHDCKLGVCMTCPAKLVSGIVDQSEGMLSDDVQEKGYALMCAAYPRSNCKIRVIPEEELLQVQLMTSDS